MLVNSNEFSVIPSQEKVRRNVLPYLTFPLTTKCIFKCAYCGDGGETTASYRDSPTLEYIKTRALEAYEYGIRKFRLTGGEPTLHPQFPEILDFLSSLKDSFLLVNTNGALVDRHEDVIKAARESVHFAVSLDSLTVSNFDRISGTQGYFERVISGVRLLARYERLFRLNMVVSTWNMHEVFHIIDFCRELKCNLKLLAVVSVPVPYRTKESLYIGTDFLESTLAQASDSIEFHQYARSFGTPCRIYNCNGVKVTLKSQSHGSHYDVSGICSECSYYPCHEGLYDLFLLPDGRLCGCRWSETSVSPGDTFLESLDRLVKVFQRADWYQRDEVVPMSPYPSFVKHALPSHKLEGNQ